MPRAAAGRQELSRIAVARRCCRALLQGGKPKPRGFLTEASVVQDTNGQLGNLKPVRQRFRHRLGIASAHLLSTCWFLLGFPLNLRD